MKSVDSSVVVGMEDEPENVRNTKVVLLDVSTGEKVCTRASIHDRPEGGYIIVYYGE